MRKLLKYAVLPEYKRANSKQDFMKLSEKFVKEAQRLASEAGITGYDLDCLKSSFIERSLGVIYDVHSNRRKVYSSQDRKAVRETIVMNGRNAPTANKVLLADCYIDLVMPISTRRTNNDYESTTKSACSRKKHAVDDARSKNKDMAELVPKRQLQKVKNKLNGTKDELAKALRELKLNREARIKAESDLQEQADVLAQTLSLLGDATAKLAEAKAKSDKENYRHYPWMNNEE